MKLKISMLAAFVLLLVNCALLQDVKERTAVRNLQVKLKSAHVTDVTWNGASVDLSFKAHNPNAYDAVVNSFDFDMLLSGVKAAKGSIRNNIRIEGTQTKDFIVPVFVSFGGLSSGIKQSVLNKQATVRVLGYITMNTTLGGLRFKVLDETPLQ